MALSVSLLVNVGQNTCQNTYQVRLINKGASWEKDTSLQLGEVVIQAAAGFSTRRAQAACAPQGAPRPLDICVPCITEPLEVKGTFHPACDPCLCCPLCTYPFAPRGHW
jgi:hypothetical protein